MTETYELNSLLSLIENENSNLDFIDEITETLNGVVYFSTYANPLYSTSDLRQIHYNTHPTY